ncbi:hypothetical protein Q0M94_25015 (plasmid) [Deinococcus radiomollis]|uniref:hypothetical protein n=1 Tax=Deinococcus radiomollis TaxID=468916 RepID=UPI003891FACB
MITVNAKVLRLAAVTAGQFKSEQLTGHEQSKTTSRKKTPAVIRLTLNGQTLLIRARSTGGELSIPVSIVQGTLLAADPPPFDVWTEAALLINYCHKISGTVTLDAKTSVLVVGTGQNTLELPLQPAQEDLPWEALEPRASFRASTLLDCILHVRHLRATGEANPSMLSAWRGLLLDGNGTALRAVAGNAYSVAICGCAYTGEPLRLLLPPGELNGLLAVLASEGDAQVQLFSDAAGSRLELRGTQGHVRMNLMDHLAFPQYAKIIPKGHALSVRVEAEDIRKALGQIKPLLGTARNEVQLHVKEGRLELRCQNEYGTAKTEVDAETTGEGLIVFNHTQLTRACSVKGPLTLSMSTTSSQPALIVKGAYVVVVAVIKPQVAA